MMKALLLAGLAALAVATSACTDDKKAPVATAPQAGDEKPVQVASAPQVPSTTASVNWEAARADMAKRPADVVVPQAAGADPLVVPMLLPSGIVQTQSDRPVAPRIVKDGYFATYHLPRYDVTVNGSARAYAVGGQTPAADKSVMRFQTAEGGASLAFSRYGADYLIDFECREVDSPDGCIGEAEAKEFAESLFVAQSR
jgi:hypothetical protein